MMGCASVYGKANDSIVKGAFLVRGQDGLQAFDVAPDWESYDFKKLDPKDEKDKEFVESMWAWDKPIEVNGKVRAMYAPQDLGTTTDTKADIRMG